jgi:Flp pilus assembly protein CpaB
MRPVRIITAVVFAAAVAVTGCAAHSTAVNPPVTPVVDAPAPPAPSPAPKPIPVPVPAPQGAGPG